jgi:hypothetical protein
MTRLQVAGLGYPQRPERPGSLRGDRLGGQADMIAALVEQRYAAYRQPIGALPEHRRAGPGIHRKAGELVDGIPGLAAEQLGERQIVRGQEVNDQVAGVQRYPVGVVGLGAIVKTCGSRSFKRLRAGLPRRVVRRVCR